MEGNKGCRWLRKFRKKVRIDRLHLRAMPGVFLSYARADGELHAAELRDRLAREASDIVIKQDRLFLEGGVGWWKQITDAIDSVEFLILVMTPAALASRQRAEGVALRPPAGRLRLSGQRRAGLRTPVSRRCRAG